MTRHFAEAFIRKEVSKKLYGEILDHLAECDDCFKYYVEKAKEMSRDIDIKQGDTIFTIKTDGEKLEIQEPTLTESVQNPYINWVEACRVTDLSVLMQAKAVRDSVKEVYDVEEGESEVFRDFGLFVIKKICQKIDHLEKCLTLAETER